MSWDLDFLLACTFTFLNIIFASAVKGGFLSESEIRFSNLQKKVFQKMGRAKHNIGQHYNITTLAML